MTEVLFYSQWYSDALAAQREGRWQDALRLIQEGSGEKNCGMCCWWLAVCYENGMWGLPQNLDEAVRWYKKGVALGNYRATICLYKTGRVDKRTFKKFQWSQHDNFGNGLRYFYGIRCNTSIASAAAEFEMAPADCCFSQTHMAMCCLMRSESLKDTIDDAVLWHKRSAALGYCASQLFLARLFEEIGDLNLAIHWSRKAAEQQLEIAVVQLILWFLRVHNNAAALYWHKRLKYLKIQNLSQKVYASFEQIEQCQKSCFTLIAIRKFCKTNLSVFPKDVVVLLAKYLWRTRDDDEAWSPAPPAAQVTTTKKLKK